MKEKVTNQVIEHSKELLTGLDWPTYPTPTVDKSLGFYGYFFKSPPEGLKNLWLGILKDSPIKGLILGAKPSTAGGEMATRKILIEGFKWLEMVHPAKSGWFYKLLIAPANIVRLSRMTKLERAKCLKILLQNTYPFTPE